MSIAPSLPCKSDNTKSISARVKAELFEALQKQSKKSKRKGEKWKEQRCKKIAVRRFEVFNDV